MLCKSVAALVAELVEASGPLGDRNIGTNKPGIRDAKTLLNAACLLRRMAGEGDGPSKR